MFFSDLCPDVGAGQRAECYAPFQLLQEEKRDFLRGWRYDQNVTSLTEDEIIDDPSLVAWRHQSWLQLKGIPFIGVLGVYPGNGYSAELGVNFEVCVDSDDKLFEKCFVKHKIRLGLVLSLLTQP